MAITENTSRRAWRTAVLGGMASYMDAATIVGTGTALVLYKQHLGLTPLMIGAASSILTLGLAIGALFGGRLGDLLGRRRVFTYDLVVFLVGLLLLAFAGSPWMIFVGVAITGLAMGADIPTSLALVAEEAPQGRRARLVAFSQVLWSCGGLAAYLIAFLVSDLSATGARIIYLHVVVVAIVVLILRQRLRESEEWVRERERQQAQAPAGVSRGDSLRRLTSGPLLGAVVGLGLFYAIGNLVANTFGQFQTFLFTEVAGAAVSTATLVGLLAYPLGFITVLIFMKFVDGPARMPLYTLGVLIMATGAAIPLIVGVNTVTLIILKFCITVGAGFAGEVIFKVWAQEFFPTLIRGTAQGIAIAFTRFVAAGFALVTPVIAESSPRALMGVLLCAVLIAAVIGWTWIFPMRRRALAAEQSAAEQEELTR
ncbi:MFS transporter [Nonomuraea sp. MG754425]|uniref:MFS transporter n=1 Tax=Nonomuraea sp. MG754425 TaxID=2570319 RepID=UPI001F335DD3|nr:MFS transporter [Nonomuraea sp. MG754425]MCF6470527.1 MFS transporter [Nonomuraea sp. MG754425]